MIELYKFVSEDEATDTPLLEFFNVHVIGIAAPSIFIVADPRESSKHSNPAKTTEAPKVYESVIGTATKPFVPLTLSPQLLVITAK